MRTFTGILFILVVALPLLAGQENLLESEWEDVLGRAAEENRHLYIVFLGEEWSVACKRFKEQILDSPEFDKLAESRLLYCPVIGQRMNSRAKKEMAKLQSLVIHFNIKQYPTVLLLSPDGNELLRHGYREESASAYVSLLEAVLPPKTSSQSDTNGS